VKVIRWSIRTFWYKGLAKNNEKWQVRKKGLYYEKIVVRIKKPFFTKVSKNRWIWHFYNVFRSAKPIQIQPINPNLINQRKIAKKNWIWFEISRICFIFFWLFVVPVQCSETPLGARSLQRLGPLQLGVLAHVGAHQKKSTKIHAQTCEIYISNTSRGFDFGLYLPDLVYWVGFGTVMTFKTHVWNVKFSYVFYLLTFLVNISIIYFKRCKKSAAYLWYTLD